MRIRPQEVAKQGLMSKFREAVNYVVKSDKRTTIGVPNKILVIGIYLVGLVGTVVFGMSEKYGLVVPFLFIPYIAGFVAIGAYAPIKKARTEVFERIYTLKRDRMGTVGKQTKDVEVNYEDEFKVLEWAEDNVSPLKLQITIPTRFDPLGEAAFLEQFNVFMGAGSKWAPDRSNPEDAGWNYPAGHVTLMKMPPLPKMALWDEHYLLNDSIAWSFFPLALGVENGVKLHNEETGEDEFVLGFDVAGAQSKMKGVQVGNEVVQAPMVLVAGGTGGGKSLSVDTQVPTISAD